MPLPHLAYLISLGLAVFGAVAAEAMGQPHFVAAAAALLASLSLLVTQRGQRLQLGGRPVLQARGSQELLPLSTQGAAAMWTDPSRLYIPSTRSVPARRRREEGGPARTEGSHLIAILDDSHAVAHGMAETLRGMGVDARAFTDEASFMERAREVCFAGFILDWNLADGTTSGAAIEALRTLGYDTKTIIVLSGALQKPPEVAAAGLLYRTKPYSCKALARDLIAVGALPKRPRPH